MINLIDNTNIRSITKSYGIQIPAFVTNITDGVDVTMITMLNYVSLYK